MPASILLHIDDVRIKEIKELVPPSHVLREFPATERAAATSYEARQALHRILYGADDRLLVIIGPCSIHDYEAAMEYARLLKEEADRLKDDLLIVMRVYFEKPRTTVGWKGLINDPYLDNSFKINEGVRLARKLLWDINELGLPCGTEFLDMITPQYIGDLISWGAIGARTTESQVHRELASGLSAPIGFKNGTDGNVKIAIDAILAARQKHHFLSIHKNGQVATVETKGNPDCHIILRGGKSTNYDAESVAAAAKALAAAGLEERLMIDCSHANSQKDHRRQVEVSAEIGRQVAAGEQRIVGVMVESHLVEGRQDLKPGMNLASLNYGQSITDACISWEASVSLLEDLAAAVRARRQRKA